MTQSWLRLYCVLGVQKEVFLGTQDYAIYPSSKTRKRDFGPEATECRTVPSRKLRQKKKEKKGRRLEIVLPF